MEKIIEISDLSKSYDKERVFEHFNMDIEEGEMVAIAGPSGSGKTTLLNLISGLDCVYDGNIFVDGSNIRKVKKSDCKKIGMIYQDYRLLEKRSVWDNVMLPLVAVTVGSPGLILGGGHFDFSVVELNRLHHLS